MALPGAMYPPSGCHIPIAATSVVTSITHNCLSRSLVYFLHDRKIVLHMIEDIKDLVQFPSSSPTAPSSPSINPTLSGPEAEEVRGSCLVLLYTIN